MVISGSIYIGFSIACTMKQRVDELHELERLIGYIEGELRYNHSLLYEAVMAAEKKAEGQFKLWLLRLSETLNIDMACDDSVNEIWRDSLLMLFDVTALKMDDLELLGAFGQAFGYLDVEAQLNAITLEKESLHERIKELSDSLKSRRKLAYSLSFLCGLGVVIILL